MTLMPTICAILYLKEVEEFSASKVMTNAVLWPWHTLWIVVDYVITMSQKDDDE